jgi:hypothetical protein
LNNICDHLPVCGAHSICDVFECVQERFENQAVLFVGTLRTNTKLCPFPITSPLLKGFSPNSPSVTVRNTIENLLELVSFGLEISKKKFKVQLLNFFIPVLFATVCQCWQNLI